MPSAWRTRKERAALTLFVFSIVFLRKHTSGGHAASPKEQILNVAFVLQIFCEFGVSTDFVAWDRYFATVFSYMSAISLLWSTQNKQSNRKSEAAQTYSIFRRVESRTMVLSSGEKRKRRYLEHYGENSDGSLVRKRNFRESDFNLTDGMLWQFSCKQEIIDHEEELYDNGVSQHVRFLPLHERRARLAKHPAGLLARETRAEMEEATRIDMAPPCPPLPAAVQQGLQDLDEGTRAKAEESQEQFHARFDEMADQIRELRKENADQTRERRKENAELRKDIYGATRLVVRTFTVEPQRVRTIVQDLSVPQIKYLYDAAGLKCVERTKGKMAEDLCLAAGRKDRFVRDGQVFDLGTLRAWADACNTGTSVEAWHPPVRMDFEITQAQPPQKRRRTGTRVNRQKAASSDEARESALEPTVPPAVASNEEVDEDDLGGVEVSA